MVESTKDYLPLQGLAISEPDLVDNLTIVPLVPETAVPSVSKQEIRSTLKASTLDGVFATLFGCATSGVLLTNFLLELGANNLEIGILSAIPMLVNFLQPVGAYLADRTTSRHHYNLWIFGLSRLLWVMLGIGIAWVSWQGSSPQQLVQWTIAVVLVASLLGSLGSANWFSWMAAVVPHRLRGRYFGFRNSATSLTSLLALPLLGGAVSAWGGAVRGYGIVLLLGVVAGIVSLGYQFLMVDVNPQAVESSHRELCEIPLEENPTPRFLPVALKDPNFLTFLLYFGLWTFAANLCAPFFNIYLLHDLHLDVTWVTIYTSLSAAANLLLLMMWGKLADRLGNRPLLILVGLLVAVTPILWLGTGHNPASLWLGLPLLHMLGGATWGAIDLCSNNIQMEIAPKRQPSTYFAIAAAVAGISGAVGTTSGGFLAELPGWSLGGLFALSSVARLAALLPLIFVREPRSQSLGRLFQRYLPASQESPAVKAEEVADRS